MQSAGFILSLPDRLRKANIARGSLWALIDQAVISIAGFGTVILLGRTLPPADFGLFIIALMLLFFLTSFQAALITQPHNVLAAPLGPIEYKLYTSGAALLQVLLATGTGIFAILIAALAFAIDWKVAPLLMLVAPATVAWQLQEFVRRILYTKSRAAGALLNDITSYGGQLVGLSLTAHLGYLTASVGMMVMISTSLMAAVLGAWQIRQDVEWPIAYNVVVTTIQENWRFGRWLLATFMLSWVSEALYPLVVAGMVGFASAAEIRAAETLLGPVQVLTLGVNSYFLSRAATLFHRGGATVLHSFITRLFITTFPLVILLSLVTALYAQPILRLVYGEYYTRSDWLVAFIAVGAVGNYVRFIVSIGIRATGATSLLFTAGLWLSATVFIVGIPAIYWFGLRGYAVALLIGAYIGTLAQWSCYKRAMQTESSVPVNVHRLDGADHSPGDTLA